MVINLACTFVFHLLIVSNLILFQSQENNRKEYFHLDLFLETGDNWLITWWINQCLAKEMTLTPQKIGGMDNLGNFHKGEETNFTMMNVYCLGSVQLKSSIFNPQKEREGIGTVTSSQIWSPDCLKIMQIICINKQSKQKNSIKQQICVVIKN